MTAGMSKNTGATLSHEEYSEWKEALADVVDEKGQAYARHLLKSVQRAVGLESATPSAIQEYVNSIPAEQDLALPEGEEYADLARKIVRWNALVMVVRAQQRSPGLGGHISSYASIDLLYQIGWDYCFRGPNSSDGGDLVYYQGHSSPGIYARSFLEGRISADQLDRFRQEAQQEPGLSSYPHPWLMPDYWQFATVSMGLGPLQGIYQARLQKYLQNRNLRQTRARKVWVFCGDGEMDEPESKGCLDIAANDHLDNLIFVVNANLQRLDGPVRGNMQIISELSRIFAAAGWRVIKVLWNSAWDEVFRRDHTGELRTALADLCDGAYQALVAQGIDALLGYLAEYSPAAAAVVRDIPVTVKARLAPGGHDPKKVYTAYQHAMQTTGRPCVVIAHTIKGYGLGVGITAANTTHQHKTLSSKQLQDYADWLCLPLTQKQVSAPDYYHPGEDSNCVNHIQQLRHNLGGYIPSRQQKHNYQQSVASQVCLEACGSMQGRSISTTMAFVRILSSMLRREELKDYIVPIVADEARTFGMEGLFRQIGIYASQGQSYEPVDKQQVMHYRESSDGQLLQEGINEAGAAAIWLAAATAYSTTDIALLPCYIFYSMFGFQRIGDLLWAAGDMRARGFLFGATSGRTTLEGEGLQHTDGNSHMLASLIPNCISYDPAYHYELAVIMRAGVQSMLEQQEDVFYYITLTNENYPQPNMPTGVERGILQGMYPLDQDISRESCGHILASGALLEQAKAAQRWLQSQKIYVCLWSVTSFTELAREGMACKDSAQQSYVKSCLQDTKPVVAVSDYVSQYPNQIRPFVPGAYKVLGTDGFGRSDDRAALRRYFAVDTEAIIRAMLSHFEENRVCINAEKLASLLQQLDQDFVQKGTL